MRKIVIGIICMLLILIAVPSSTAVEGPQLDIYILPGQSFPSPTIKVTNRGDATAHNVRMTDVNIEGNVLYNDRVSTVAESLEPSSYALCSPNSWVIGLGLFTMNVTIECDEGVFTSESVNGIIIGALQLIP